MEHNDTVHIVNYVFYGLAIIVDDKAEIFLCIPFSLNEIPVVFISTPTSSRVLEDF